MRHGILLSPFSFLSFHSNLNYPGIAIQRGRMSQSAILVLLVGFTLALNSAAPTDDILVEDFQFSVDPKALQENEMAENIRQISKVVMGIAELVVDIRADLKGVRGDVLKSRRVGRDNTAPPVLDDPERVRRNHALAAKLERLFGADDVDPELVERTKEELKKTMQVNFMRSLSALLVSGPMRTQERKEDILRLMKSVLNGELDFGPVVDRLPFIMRDSETKQFIHLLNALKEGEAKHKRFRQTEDEDDDGDSEEKTVQQQPISKDSVVQQSITPLQVFRQPVQQISGVQVPQSQQAFYINQQGNIVSSQGNIVSSVGTTAAGQTQGTQSVPTALQSPGAPQFAQQQPIPVAPVPAAAPIPIIVQLAQPPAPTMAPKTGLQKFIETLSSVNVGQLTEFVLKLPELFQGVEGLVEGLGIDIL